MNTIALADVPATPWRNGGGTTRELLAWPGTEDWRVRISVAEVAADGPFSAYPGVTRWFAVLAGAGVQLQVDQTVQTLTTQSEPLCFDGALPVGCRLVDGATQDFNLMLRDASGTLQRVHGTLERKLDAPKLVAAYAHRARATACFGSEKWQIPAGSLAWLILKAPTSLRLEAQDALWMEIAL